MAANLTPRFFPWLGSNHINALVVDRAHLSAKLRARISLLASRAHLFVLSPRVIDTRSGRSASALDRAVQRACLGGKRKPCAILAPSVPAAVELSGAGAADFIAVHLSAPQDLARLGAHGSTPIVAIIGLAPPPKFDANAWASAIARTSASGNSLDLAVAPTRHGRATAISAFLTVLRRTLAGGTPPSEPPPSPPPPTPPPTPPPPPPPAGGDTAPPTQPGTPSVIGTTQTSITIGWTASSDNVGVTGYDVYRNGTLAAKPASTSYTFSGLQCGTSYALSVDAFDAAGNKSPQNQIDARTADCRLPGDTTPPTVPGSFQLTGSTTATLSVSWAASTDDVGVAGYGLYLNGTLVTSTTATSFTFVGVACGTTYTLAVDAFDGAGNRSAKASLSTGTSACPPPPPPPPPPPGPVGTALPSLLPTSSGSTFYVSTSGADTNPGTAAAPWRTVQKALDSLQPGETVLVHSGTYTEDLVMSHSGTASAPITLAAYPGESVTLQPASTSGDTYPIQITGSYFRLRGFTLQNATGTSSTDVYLEGSANHIEVSGNNILHSQDQGVYADPGTSSLYLLGNLIHDNGWGHVSGQHQSHGLYIEGANDLIANNVIYNQPYGFGIQLYPSNQNSIVTDNTVVHNGFSGIVLGGGNVSGAVVRDNIFAFNAQYGVAVDATCPSSSIADHNVLFGNGAGATEGGCGGLDVSGGNVLSDPLFASDSGHDYHLQSGSGAIDAALPDFSMVVDFDGRSRPQGALPDIGAYEH